MPTNHILAPIKIICDFLQFGQIGKSIGVTGRFYVKISLRYGVLEMKGNSMTHKIALITGGSRGLGENTALHLAKNNIDTIITYHSQADKAEKVVQKIKEIGGNAVALQLDVEKSDSFDGFSKELKKALKKNWQRENFDFLVNNAGYGVYKPFVETTEADFDSLMNCHVKGVFFLTQKLLPIIVDGGRILNVSTGLTRFTIPGFAAYAMMKGAVETLSLYLAKELGVRNISVNTIAPGAVETDFGGGMVRDTPEVNQMMSEATAMGRVGLPDDIGGVIASILSGENQWLTAQRIEVSGGQSI